MPKTCADVMTKDPTCCSPNDTVMQAARIMRDEDVGPVPVVESKDNKKLVGIVTDPDLALKAVAEGVDPKTARIEEMMSRNPVTCHPSDDIEKAIELMCEHQVRRIPVVDDSQRVVGIIAQADVATRTRDKEMTAELVEEVSK